MCRKSRDPQKSAAAKAAHREAVSFNAAFPQLDGQNHREMVDGGLAHRVGGHSWVRVTRERRRQIVSVRRGIVWPTRTKGTLVELSPPLESRCVWRLRS